MRVDERRRRGLRRRPAGRVRRHPLGRARAVAARRGAAVRGLPRVARRLRRGARCRERTLDDRLRPLRLRTAAGRAADRLSGRGTRQRHRSRTAAASTSSGIGRPRATATAARPDDRRRRPPLPARHSAEQGRRGCTSPRCARPRGRLLAPQFAEILEKTAQPFLQPIYDVASSRLAFDRIALMGDAAFVARPHVGMGVTKAAEDAMALCDAIRPHGATPAALAAFEAVRLPAGQAVVERGRKLGAYMQAQGRAGAATVARDAETVLRETAIDLAARRPQRPHRAAMNPMSRAAPGPQRPASSTRRQTRMTNIDHRSATPRRPRRRRRARRDAASSTSRARSRRRSGSASRRR